MTQPKMQAYMDRHKLGPLFEDLMNRILRDMPEEPMVYLLRTLYKKAGMEIPQDIRYGGLRKSVDMARSRSPERVMKSTDPNAASGKYEKPWMTHQRRMRPRHSAEDQTGKKRPEWHGDTKVMARSFDDLWEDGQPSAASPGKRPRPKTDPRSSWAAVGLDNGDAFTSGEYRGPSRQGQRTDEELLAAETTMRSSAREAERSPQSAAVASASRAGGQRADSQRHRQQLESMLSSQGSAQAGTDRSRHTDQDEEDQALELLENAEDLTREGVKNVSAAGYKLSKIMRERKNESVVKLNINLSPRGGGMKVSDSMQSLEGYESDRENVSPAGQWTEEDDEFESVSQVTGPRRPVWNLPDSDAESTVPHRSKKHPRSHQRGRRDLAASVPNSLQQMALTAGDLDIPVNQTWSPELNAQEAYLESQVRRVKDWVADARLTLETNDERLTGNSEIGSTQDSSPELERKTAVDTARSGGWDLPDDSDAASVLDWNQRVKGKKRDPRSY